jgi:nucleoside-diphosphate-sugar epimerase
VRLGPLDTWRDFVDVRDVARAVIAVLEAGGLPPLLNVGRGEAVHARALIDQLIAASGTGATVVEEAAEHASHAGSPAATVPWQQADLTLVTSHLGWSPSIDIETSVRDTWLTD